MSCYSKLLKNSTEYNELLKAINASLLPSGVTGLPPSPKAHLIHSLCEDTSRRALVILPNEAAASRLVSDINEFVGNEKKAYLYPARDYSFNSSEGQSREFEQARIKTLCKIINEDYSVIACSAEAALQLTITPEELKKRTKIIDGSTTITPEDLITTLVSAGFKRADIVEGTGQFAHRGGIVDFFPVNSEKPVRIELWGDSIDNISEFDPSTQRRTDILDFIEITPATEILFDSDEVLKEKIEGLYNKVSGKGSVKVKQNLLKDIDNLNGGIRIASLDKYLNLAYHKPASIFDFCKGDLLYICETAGVKESATNTHKLMLEEIKAQFENGILTKGLDRISLDIHEFFALYEDCKAIYLDSLPRGSFDTPIRTLTTFNSQQLPIWNGTLSVLLDDLRPALKKGITCIVNAGTQKAAKSLVEALEAEDINAIYLGALPSEFPQKTVSVTCGGISSGFTYPNEKFMIFTYGRVTNSTNMKRRKSFKAADVIQSLEELTRGDYVVHSVHGIGIFEGIQKMEVSGLIKDYIKVKYAKGDTLYVPVTQLDLISKYIGPKDEQKTLSSHVLAARIGKKQKQKYVLRLKIWLKS